LGNSQFINDDDTTPSAADNTDFGSLRIGQALTHTFTISNSGSANLTLTGLPRVSITGAAASDFSVTSQASTPIGSNTTTTFQVRFSPSLSGARTVTVTIASNDSDVNSYNFTLQGTGSGSLINIYLPLIAK
jgi:trimeric autotransporter adhesin